MTPWKKHHPLTDKNAFICLVDHMGDDSSIVQAARVSYGKDERDGYVDTNTGEYVYEKKKLQPADRQLIRYLMNHSHTTPFEMVEIKFMVQVPMDCWRQWIRHRTASVNEYSTRYTEALDFFQVTDPSEWRLQATDNKQGSSGFLEEWPQEGEWQSQWDIRNEEGFIDGCLLKTAKQEVHIPDKHQTPGQFLSAQEGIFHKIAKQLYSTRLGFGIAKEQARKDLPLSTYTRAYWKCDLHNIFNFLRLRMDSHAQIEIRSFANCMFEIVKEICPVACEAFEDYALHAKRFSRMEMEVLRDTLKNTQIFNVKEENNMTDREWKEFLTKIG